MNLKKAFSLIELLVVIAIVGIISAIAVPSYKAYKIQATLSGTLGNAQQIMSQMIEYAEKKGVFPSAGELGYNTTISSLDVTDPAAINSNFSQVEIRDLDVSSTRCGRAGRVRIIYDSSEVGFPAEATYLLDCIAFHVNGIWQKICTAVTSNLSNPEYVYYTGMIPGTYDFYSESGGLDPDYTARINSLNTGSSCL